MLKGRKWGIEGELRIESSLTFPDRYDYGVQAKV